MAWELAPSLVNLRNEIHARWPNHDRTSDGSIGDADHSSSASDHNPNSRGMVCAIDEDKDGVDMRVITAAFERHPSSHYWIFWFPGDPYPVIADRDNNWNRVKYTGSNKHDKHAHFSIRQSSSAEQNQTAWGIWPIPEEGLDMNNGEVHAAVWDDFTVSEVGDYDGDGVRDKLTPKQILHNVHEGTVVNRENIKAVKGTAEEALAIGKSNEEKLNTILGILQG